MIVKWKITYLDGKTNEGISWVAEWSSIYKKLQIESKKNNNPIINLFVNYPKKLSSEQMSKLLKQKSWVQLKTWKHLTGFFIVKLSLGYLKSYL